MDFPLPSEATASLVLHQCSNLTDDGTFVPEWDLVVSWASISPPLWNVPIGLGGLINQMSLDVHYEVTSGDIIWNGIAAGQGYFFSTAFGDLSSEYMMNFVSSSSALVHTQGFQNLSVSIVVWFL